MIMIPKIIHYCWLSNDPIPQDLQNYMKTWNEVLPDYEFIKWDFNRFPKNKSKWVSDAFDNKKYAFAADYIRLYAIYHYGGIYLDMDVEVLKKFDKFLSLKTMLCWQNQWPGLEVAAFGAEKGSGWIKDCLDFYDHRHFITANGEFNMKPIPGLIEEYLGRCGYCFKNVESIEEALSEEQNPLVIPVLSYEYFSPKSYKNDRLMKTEKTVCIHQFAGSWLSKAPWYSKMEKKIWNSCGLHNKDLIKRFLAIWKK